MPLKLECKADLLEALSERYNQLICENGDQKSERGCPVLSTPPHSAEFDGFEPENCLKKVMVSLVPKIERGEKTALDKEDLGLIQILGEHCDRTIIGLRYLDSLNFIFEISEPNMPGFCQFKVTYLNALRRFLNA